MIFTSLPPPPLPFLELMSILSNPLEQIDNTVAATYPETHLSQADPFNVKLIPRSPDCPLDPHIRQTVHFDPHIPKTVPSEPHFRQTVTLDSHIDQAVLFDPYFCKNVPFDPPHPPDCSF